MSERRLAFSIVMHQASYYYKPESDTNHPSSTSWIVVSVVTRSFPAANSRFSTTVRVPAGFPKNFHLMGEKRLFNSLGRQAWTLQVGLGKRNVRAYRADRTTSSTIANKTKGSHQTTLRK